MNKLDPRFLKGTDNFIRGTINENGLTGSADTIGKYRITSAQLETSPQYGFPKNSIAYFDGERWINYMPHAGERYLYDNKIYEFNGTDWETKHTLSVNYGCVDKIVRFSGNAKRSVNNNKTYTYNVGDKFLCKSDCKIYTITAIDDEKNITWDDGTALSGTSPRIYSVIDYGIYTYTKQDGEEKLDFSTTDDFVFVYVKETGKLYYGIYVNSKQDALEVVTTANSMKVETHTLTAEEVTAKSFTLSKSVATGEENNVLCFVSGVVQPVNIAFTVSGNTVGWSEKTLDGNVSAGDVFIIQYYAGS